MPEALDIPRLLEVAGRTRDRRADDLLARFPSWEPWRAAFQGLHFERPEDERRLGQLLAGRARRRGDRGLAARFELVTARALHRAGDAAEATRAYARAERALRGAGLSFEAAAARVMSVDALAVAGRVREGLRVAERAAASLRGERGAPWRAILLGNRANALRLLGDLPAATRAYASAERAFAKQGNTYAAAVARSNAGVAWMDAGDAGRARRRFAGALAVFEAGGFADPALEARYNLACADVRAGRLGEGVRALASLAEEHERRGLGRRGALCRMDLADALGRAGDRSAAEEEAVRAAADFAEASAHAERAEALVAAAAHSDGAPAARRLREARRAAVRSGREALVLRCDLLAAVHRPDPRDLQALRRRAEALGQDDLSAQATLLEASQAVEAGRPAAALRLLSGPRFARSGRPWMRVAADTIRARAEASLGRTPRALARLRRVLSFLDAIHGGLPGAWLRATFVLERMDPYLTYVDLLLGRGRARDRREAEALLDRLAARRFLASRSGRLAGAPGLAGIRRRLEAIYDRLGTRPLERGVAAEAIPALAAEARRLERSATASWRRHEIREAVSPKESGARREGVRPDTILVHVWRRVEDVRAILRSSRGVEGAFDLGPVAAWVERAEALRFHARRAALPGDAGRAAFDAALADLARLVLTPLGPAEWPERVHLVLDPRLPDVPWEHLPVAGTPLAATRDVLRVPAARLAAPRRPRGRGTTVIALGEPDLPSVAEESERVGSAAGATRVRASEATRARVAEALATSEVVHLAGHGFDVPEAAPLGGVRIADGWFAATDVPERIAADLVVLGACRTGRVAGTSGLAWGGLPTALLAAGARTILWTADDVDDRAAAAFLSRFHTEFGNERRSGRARRDAVAAFGRALVTTGAELGSSALLLPFRLSGVPR